MRRISEARLERPSEIAGAQLGVDGKLLDGDRLGEMPFDIAVDPLRLPGRESAPGAPSSVASSISTTRATNAFAAARSIAIVSLALSRRAATKPLAAGAAGKSWRLA
jgi:hypothetical protein